MAKKFSKKPKTKVENVRFDLYAPEAQKVSLAGDFNGWDINGVPMIRDREGTWETSVGLQPSFLMAPLG